MSRESLLLSGDDIVGKHFQTTARRHRRVELSNRSRSSVARIRKARLAFFFAFSIDFLEDAAAKVTLAAHLDFACHPGRAAPQLQRDAPNCPHVRRDVLTAETITPRDAAHEHAVFVVNRQRQAVDLQLRDVLRRLSAGEFPAAFVERAQLVDVVAVVER